MLRVSMLGIGTGRLERLDRLWRRHSRRFWILHSIWALGTGILVIWLAHERYGFAPWVMGFLLLTWASTLFFSRPPTEQAQRHLSARVRRGLVSYVTRVLYQETLFFLLPFYAYSIVFPSWNVIFPLVLALLAFLACLDLVFDRWLQQSPAFGLVFFASVTFGALNLVLPMLLTLRLTVSTPVAAVAALAIAAPLAVRARGRGTGSRLWLTAAGFSILAVAIGAPQLVPPVPLRLEAVTFAADLDRTNLEPSGVIQDDADSGSLNGRMVVLVRVFAPSNVPTRVVLDWYRDRSLVRNSREVEIVAHHEGFRLWDALRADGGTLPPGMYNIVLRTADNRMFGTASIRLH